MAKVIKDRVTGSSKCYGFVKYSDVQQANNAIVSMNGYRLDGKNLAVRVAGKPPQPAVPPGPPAPSMPMYPAPTQVPGSYPAQQLIPGALPNAPPTTFVSAPVPWGPPIPNPYATYPPPPPVSTLYAPVPGQPVPPYGAQYPLPVPTVSLVDTSQTVSSAEAQQSYQTSTPAQSFPSYVYGNSVTTVPASAQPEYPAASFAYTSYYGVPPPVTPPPVAATNPLPQSTVDHSQIIGNVPWASNPPVPPPPASSAETTTNSADTEYEKFMGEMK